MKSKKLLFFSALILIIIIASAFFFFKYPKKDSHGCLISEGYFWCEQNNKCVQNEKDCFEEDVKLEILENMKQVIGMDLNLLDRVARWNNYDNKEITLDGKGFYYTDLQQSERILGIFKNVDDFLKQNGFADDPLNEQKELSKRYIDRDRNIVANIEIIDNPNETSSLIISLADTDKIICDFDTDCGTECNEDSDCHVILDGCNKMTVCRNKNYKFFNNCSNPTSLIDEIDFKVQNCQCLENKCAYKEPEQ